MQDIYTLTLADIAPSSITQDSQVPSLITALDPQFQDISRASLEPLILARIDELPDGAVDLLAWQLHVDFYDLAATPSMKREAVKESILWHMHKGTQWAIIEALREIGIEAEFIHWHDSGDEPYTFKLNVKVVGDYYRTQGRDKLIASIRRAVDESKSARSYLAGLDTRMEFREDLGLYVGTSQILSGHRRLMLAKPILPKQLQIYSGIGTALQGQHRILLPRENDIASRIFAANITFTNIDQNIGLETDELQELLLRFEQRILDRIDAYETRLMETLNQNQEQTNRRLEDILELIRWKGDDEAI